MRGEARRLAEMRGEEGQELAQVPAIGLDGLRREAALLGEGGEPGQRLAAGVGRAGTGRGRRASWRLASDVLGHGGSGAERRPTMTARLFGVHGPTSYRTVRLTNREWPSPTS